jgi:hypothetical protein
MDRPHQQEEHHRVVSGGSDRDDTQKILASSRREITAPQPGSSNVQAESDDDEDYVNRLVRIYHSLFSKTSQSRQQPMPSFPRVVRRRRRSHSWIGNSRFYGPIVLLVLIVNIVFFFPRNKASEMIRKPAFIGSAHWNESKGEAWISDKTQAFVRVLFISSVDLTFRLTHCSAKLLRTRMLAI